MQREREQNGASRSERAKRVETLATSLLTRHKHAGTCWSKVRGGEGVENEEYRGVMTCVEECKCGAVSVFRIRMDRV